MVAVGCEGVHVELRFGCCDNSRRLVVRVCVPVCGLSFGGEILKQARCVRLLEMKCGKCGK